MRGSERPAQLITSEPRVAAYDYQASCRSHATVVEPDTRKSIRSSTPLDLNNEL